MTQVLLALVFVLAPMAQPPHPGAPILAPHEGTWIVEVIDNIKVMPASRIIMIIRATTISGAASCNTYRGSLAVSAGRVTMGQLLTTMKACDSARMSEEKDFFAFLPHVTKVDVAEAQTLVLTTTDGRTVRARRIPGE